MKTFWLGFPAAALMALALLLGCTRSATRSDIALEMTDQDSIEAIIDQDLKSTGSTVVDVDTLGGTNISPTGVAYIDEVELQKPVLVETDQTLKSAVTGVADTDVTLTPPMTAGSGAIVGTDIPEAADALSGVGVPGVGAASAATADLEELERMARSPALPAGDVAISPARDTVGVTGTTEPVAARPPGSGYYDTYYRTDQLPPTYPQHTVRGGETLWSISKQYGCSISDLAAANGIGRGSVLRVGQVLIVPTVKKTQTAAAPSGTAPAPATDSDGGLVLQPSTSTGTATPSGSGAAPAAGAAPVPSYATDTYTVQQGDSYWKIARRYGVSAAELMSLNDTASDKLAIGQKILVPRKP